MASVQPTQGRGEEPETSSDRNRRVPVLAAVAVVAGAVALAFLVVRATGTGGGAPVADDLARILGARQTVVSDEAADVARRWILGAVTRDDLDGSYDLTHEDIRGSMSRAEWATGNIPVIPYPVGHLVESSWEVTYAVEDEVVMDVAVVPPEDASERPLVFCIGLKRVGEGADARWLVSYWSPRARVPVPVSQ